MYTKQLPFKDFFGKARNKTIHFNLTEREVFKLMVEFKAIFDWREKINVEEVLDLDPAEVVEFYNNFEEILLSAYGIPSDDGLYFEKGDRYRFEESAMFAAYMVETVKDTTEVNRFIEKVMPEGMEDLVKNADANLAVAAANSENPEDLRAEIARLRAQTQQSQSESAGTPSI